MSRRGNDAWHRREVIIAQKIARIDRGRGRGNLRDASALRAEREIVDAVAPLYGDLGHAR